MFILYDLIFVIIAVIYLPIYIIRGKFHSGFFSRLGFLPKLPNLDRPIWIHAVSVGEAKAIKVLIEELRKVYPAKRFVISTVTATGNKIARGIAKEGDLVTYLPLDLSFIVGRVLDLIKPCLFIIAETEIWPNLIRVLSKRKVPVVTVNGRISDSSFKGYLAIKLLVRPILRKISLFCVQTLRDSERLECLGVSADKVRVTGNMKFDGSFLPSGANGHSDLRQQMDLHPMDKILVAGSTHAPEEEIILGIYKSLLAQIHELKLVIAPRHPERSSEIEKIVSRFGFSSVLTSALPFKCVDCISTPVFIVDSIGRLIDVYAEADAVFVGGSMAKKGGQNILEPASLGKPVIFGPHMFNFRDIAELFIRNKAAILVNDAQELKKEISSMFNDPIRGREMGERARKLIYDNKGATVKTVELIKAFL